MPDEIAAAAAPAEGAAPGTAEAAPAQAPTANEPETVPAPADQSTPGAEPAGTPPEPPDWRKTYEADESFRRYVDERAAVLSDKRFQKAQRRAALAEAKDDPLKAQQFAEREHAQLEAEEPSPATARARLLEQQDRVTRSLEDHYQADDGTWDGNYLAVIRERGAEAQDLWNSDPKKYLRWVADEIRTAGENAAVKRTTPALAEALATERTAAALKHVPMPLLGSGQGISATDYQQLTPEARRELKKTPEGRRKLDELVARMA